MATKFSEIFTLLLSYVVPVKSNVKISQNFVAFSEYMNFTYSCFTGFSGGAYALVAPYYVSEIAETSMRGALASLMQLMVTFGVLFVNALNIYDTVHWVTISGICIGIPGKKVFLLPNYYQFYSNAKCG